MEINCRIKKKTVIVINMSLHIILWRLYLPHCLKKCKRNSFHLFGQTKRYSFHEWEMITWKMWYNQHATTVAQEKIPVPNGIHTHELSNTRREWFIDIASFTLQWTHQNFLWRWIRKRIKYFLQMLFLSQLFIVELMIHPTVMKSQLGQKQVQRINMSVRKCLTPLAGQFLQQLLFHMFKNRNVKLQWFLL